MILEGLSAILIWLGLTFWIGLALDYLPVLVGASEMPREARVAMLTVITGVAAVIAYFWIIRRVRARWRNKSLAVLVERRHPTFADRLVSSVELEEQRQSLSPMGQRLLDVTNKEIDEEIVRVEIHRLFNPAPLARVAGLATFFAITVIVFGIFATHALTTWAHRLYGLSDEPWPRRAAIEVVGFEETKTKKIARGSNFVLRVRADAKRPTPPPEVCTVHFRTADGERGRVNMNQQGSPRDGYQYYLFDDKPFRTLLNDVTFDVVGFDHRVRDYHLRVVASPVVESLRIQSHLPDYTGLLPRTEVYRDGMRLPRGTRITVLGRANKPLENISVLNLTTNESFGLQPTDTAGPENNLFRYELGELNNSVRHEIELLDQDGVVGQQPFFLLLQSVEDQPPEVDMRLRGIGTAITQTAILPMEGAIADDYGVQAAWFELQMEDEPPLRVAISVASSADVTAALDLKELQASASQWQFPVGSSVKLHVAAADRFDLEDEPNVGQSDPYELEVVTPSQLLALLEAHELGLRLRLTQIIGELRETRDSLSEVTFMEKNDPHAGEVGQGNPEARETLSRDVENVQDVEANLADADTVDRARALVRLRVQRARQHGQRAEQEVLGVALSFEDIRDELVNNRVDSQDRRRRIEQDIVAPLKAVAENRFPQLHDRLQELENQLTSADFGRMKLESMASVDEILAELENVLARLLELEDFNDLIEIVRSLIEEQQALAEETKKQRKRQALELLK